MFAFMIDVILTSSAVALVMFLRSVSATAQERCFCHLTGQIDDCLCDIETLQNFNNEEIYPLVQELIKNDFFRYYKVNLFKKCKYFDDIGTCENEACGVKPCAEDELPIGLRKGNGASEFVLREDCGSSDGSIGNVNETLSNKTLNFLDAWDKHDDTLNPFCDIDDEVSTDSKYVDLINNPERFTGYKGPNAWRIWKAIYKENCFMPETKSRREKTFYEYMPQNDGNAPLLSDSDLEGLCLEQRVFYRVISGLHTSINIHLCFGYLFVDEWEEQRWGPNLEEFQRRFDPAITNGEGTYRLKNLYFVYLLELRALSKVWSYFNRSTVVLYTGKPSPDEVTKKMLNKLLKRTKKFPMHFNEDLMFQDKNAQLLKKEFAQRFLNVTRIIDCVTCEKCRLWGKLQTQGLGTALKILFSGTEINGGTKLPFKLIRQEVVSLINAFARLSSSIKALETFHEMLTNETSHRKNGEL